VPGIVHFPVNFFYYTKDIEHSNEVWNFGFSQYIYNEVRAKANNVTVIQNYVSRVFQISKIFRSVCFLSLSFLFSIFLLFPLSYAIRLQRSSPKLTASGLCIIILEIFPNKKNIQISMFISLSFSLFLPPFSFLSHLRLQRSAVQGKQRHGYLELSREFYK
jgi:hypothetical protein